MELNSNEEKLVEGHIGSGFPPYIFDKNQGYFDPIDQHILKHLCFSVRNIVYKLKMHWNR